VSPVPSLWTLLDAVKDPEIPVVSIWELGILQDICQPDEGVVRVKLTPTYSGCPAMDVIAEDIVRTLECSGYPQVEIERSLSPAWSSTWILPNARRRMRNFGIVPPVADSANSIACPQCDSTETLLVSEFGSTACKALYRCSSCGEPFDYFKPHLKPWPPVSFTL